MVRLPPPLRRTAAHAWQRLPPTLRRATIQAASLVQDGPTVGLPAVDRVLLVAPHPDDETIGAGGTLRLLADAGTDVEVVCVTDGEATIGATLPRDEIAARRRAELVAACALLGTRPPASLGLPDGAVAAHQQELVGALQQHLDRVEPDLVLAPWPLDRHPDHLAVADAMVVLRAPRGTELWSYEAHLPLPPTRVVHLGAAVEAKRAALDAHATAAEAFDLHAMLGLSRWRSLLTDAGRGHAEAFLACRWDEVGDVHAALTGRTPPAPSPDRARSPSDDLGTG